MLKFLTHKLRTHSLNEESVSEKVEGRDSGTESDDEADRAHPGIAADDVIMKWNDVTDIRMGEESSACAPRLLAPDVDHLYDQHSSEEELEVYNGAPAEVATSAGESRRRGASSPPPSAPEKRRWPAEQPPTRPPSDDEDDTKVETPVQFRTSPPLEALKPRRARASPPAGARSPAPPRTPAVTYSPRRRRHPQPPPPRRHRPALDFDKMQQLKVGGVTSWRQVGGAGGELSVYCW